MINLGMENWRVILIVFSISSILVLAGFSANEKAYAQSFGDFTCWNIESVYVTEVPPITIEDQFDIVENNNWRQSEYCTATEKNGEESPFSPDLNQHYQSWFYPDQFDNDAFGQQVILYVPQFRHSFLTEIGFLDQLLVPADKKFENGTIRETADLEQHWNCYLIDEPKPITDNVNLLTQHGTINDVQIDDAFLLCTPVKKTHNGVFGSANLEEHLVCYDITAIGEDETVDLPADLNDQISNGFIPISFNTEGFPPNGLEKLCVTAEKSFPTVGGIDVSINTSALLLAGVQSISMWMIPVVAAGVGIGIFVIKRRK